MRIGFFGGSFDPPHLGHLAIARAAATAFSLDKLLFAPTGHQPLKPTGPAASFDDRLALVTLLCAADPTFHASTLEAPIPGTPNYTVDTLQRLRSTLAPADTLFNVTGLDAFLDLPRWRSPQNLLTLAEWIVVTRPGFSPTQIDTLALTSAQRTHVHLLEGIAEPATATHIRTQLAAGSPCDDLLPPAILTYIRSHHLYRT